jgi:hypothetical protein
MTVLDQLTAAVGGDRGSKAADRLCAACVELFDVEGAALSLVLDGAPTGTLGASGSTARLYDELQFTYGEGLCLDTVTLKAPVMVIDLADPRGGALAGVPPCDAGPPDPRRICDAGDRRR